VLKDSGQQEKVEGAEFVIQLHRFTNAETDQEKDGWIFNPAIFFHF